MSKLRSAFKAFRTALTDVPADMNTFGQMMMQAAAEDAFANPINIDAIRTNAYTNIAVGKIATNAARAKMAIKNGDDLITNGPIIDLFNWVNPSMSESQLIQASSSWWNTRGEFIWILDIELPGKVPHAIYTPDPKDMIHYLDAAKENITLWEYQTPTGERIPLQPYEIFHVKDWNPFSQFRGVNPLYAMADELESDFLANILNNALLRNRATPDGILMSDQSISDEDANDIRARWTKAHATGGAHSIAVLGQGTKYQHIALTLADMEFYTMKKWNRTTIAGKYGVPPAVMGYKDENTPLSGADTKEQMAFFWMQTIIPFLKTVADKINSDFMLRYAPDLHFEFDLGGIHELAEDTEKIRERARKDIASGLLLINEAREEIGHDGLPWGDKWFKPINLVPYDGSEPIVPETKESVDERDISTLFLKAAPDIYPEVFKNTHWWSLHNELEPVLVESGKLIHEWLYNMRSEHLASEDVDEVFWAKHKQYLYTAASSIVAAVGELSEIQLRFFYEELKIYSNQTDVLDKKLTDKRLSHFGYFFERLKKDILKSSDKKTFYNEMKAFAATVTETEALALYNEHRAASFKASGFVGHIWIAPQDGSETDLDVAGEVRMIGDSFSNNKTSPENKSITLPIEVNE